jgi:prophage regulatory protein
MTAKRPTVKPFDRVLRRPEVVAFSGLTETVLDEQIKLGRFPKPIQISQRRPGWLQSELQQWLAARVAERDSAA